MNKAELITSIAEQSGLTKIQAEAAFKATFDTITTALVKQDKIMIPGFGGFGTKLRPERKGRNPSTGKEMIIPKAVIAHFKAASQLKESVNTEKN